MRIFPVEEVPVFTVEKTPLADVIVYTPRVFGDARGWFMETYNARYAAEAGLPVAFVQDNHSFSGRGVLRGLHYQYPTWQGKLVRVVSGEIFDVAVDIRRASPTFGRWFGTNLSAENRKQMYIPEGFAHGFCVLSDTAEVLYKCTTSYVPSEDRCLLWNDLDIGIDWPLAQPLVSEKDARGVPLRELSLD
jgi:dTDP-4-dehydrorhamnose 3,5-epimerase